MQKEYSATDEEVNLRLLCISESLIGPRMYMDRYTLRDVPVRVLGSFFCLFRSSVVELLDLL